MGLDPQQPSGRAGINLSKDERSRLGNAVAAILLDFETQEQIKLLEDRSMRLAIIAYIEERSQTARS